ncbi:hypothetical protein E4T49_08181 [Aureobasidium sp. EXF-10728]|nr:hypothetical protein E4T49_08181 [Aureobasidium sp. EXF-10728]
MLEMRMRDEHMRRFALAIHPAASFCALSFSPLRIRQTPLRTHRSYLHSVMASTIELPKEIWLEVFSHLDYFALKNCMSVSKAFKNFTKLPTCQKTMFRSKTIIPDGGTIDLKKLRVHPVFDCMLYECATDLDEVYLGDDTVLAETCAADEYATDPPVAFLRLRVVEWKPVQITNKSGVTVLQVMKSLCRFFSNEDHLYSRGDHTGWTGWDEIKLDRKGRLTRLQPSRLRRTYCEAFHSHQHVPRRTNVHHDNTPYKDYDNNIFKFTYKHEYAFHAVIALEDYKISIRPFFNHTIAFSKPKSTSHALWTNGYLKLTQETGKQSLRTCFRQ